VLGKNDKKVTSIGRKMMIYFWIRNFLIDSVLKNRELEKMSLLKYMMFHEEEK